MSQSTSDLLHRFQAELIALSLTSERLYKLAAELREHFPDSYELDMALERFLKDTLSSN